LTLSASAPRTDKTTIGTGEVAREEEEIEAEHGRDRRDNGDTGPRGGSHQEDDHQVGR
jgi:hypothetical protein